MARDVLLLRHVRGKVLDKYLAKGWYRSGRFVFTTAIVEPMPGSTYPVFWLRYSVAGIALSAKNKKIAKTNEVFSVVYRRFSLTHELRELHKAYFDSLSFNTSPTLEDLLMDIGNNIFDTYVIEVRDKNLLIAAGIFDKGTHSIAGIVNFYRPEYKKYSPGKYLMLLKYTYCRQHGIPYYYPGYYSTTNPVFDYKLFVDKNATEVYLPEINSWVPYPEFAGVNIQG